MKKLFSALFISVFAVAAAAQTHVRFDLAAPFFNANPASNRVVTLQPTAPFPGNLVTYTSSAAGVFYFSNAWASDYVGEIRAKGAATRIPFQITVTATNLGVVDADDVTSVLGQQSYPVSGRSSWSIQSSDQRYVRQGQGGIAAAAGTNVTATTNGSLVTFSADPPHFIAAGSNVVVVTNGNLYTVHGTATGSGGTGISTNFGSGSSNYFASATLSNAVVKFPLRFTDSGGNHYGTLTAVADDTLVVSSEWGLRLDKPELQLGDDGTNYSFDVIDGQDLVLSSTGVGSPRLRVQGGVVSESEGFTGNGGGLSNTPVNIWAQNPKLSNGAVFDGVTDDTVALSNAVRAVSATNGSVFIPPGTTYLANSFDATNSVSWWFSPGGRVSVADGKTLNIRGDVVASPSQHLFTGYGRTYFRTNARLPRVWVDWFGADNRGAVESSTNLQRAIDAARFTRNESYDRLGQGTFTTSVKNQFAAHTPASRQLAFTPGGAFYFITNNLISQELWHGKIEGNQATIVGLNTNNPTAAMWAFNDCRYTIIEDLVFKAMEGATWRFGLVFSNINTVETQTTPYQNYLGRLKFYGHRDGWLYCLGIGFGNDANNEAFTVDTCEFHDYARGGAVINNSQSFAVEFINNGFSGGGRGWFGVTSWDPEFAPNGSGTFFIEGGTGGAHYIADFLATGLRPYKFKFNSEESFLAVTARFFPVHTNQFAFQADGLNFYGTNNLVAGWCLSTTTLVTTAYTNDYSSYANKWVYEWLISTGGVHRIAVNAPSTSLSELDQHIIGRPYNPSTASGTLFNVVKVGPNGITNSFTTRGQMVPLNNSATPWELDNYNFSSSQTAKDGAVLRSGTRRTIKVSSSRFNTDRPATFEVYGGSQSTTNEDGSITIESTNFQMQDSVTPVPTMNQRVIAGRGDTSYDTNGVGGVDVRIVTQNNNAASVNVHSNSWERYRQKVQMDIYGDLSYLGVGGLGLYGLIVSGNVTNAAGYRVVYQNDELGTNVTVADLRARSVSGTAALTLTKNHAAAGPLITTAGDGGAEMLRLDNNGGLSLGLLAAGYYGLTPVGGLTNAAGARVAFLDDNFAPDINQVLNAGSDAGGESLVGLASLVATNIYTHRLWNTNEVGYIAPPTNAPTIDWVLLSSGPHSSRWGPLTGGGDALTSGTLGQFAATTSAQLRGVLSDETGGGEAMFDYGFSADGTNVFRDNVIFTNAAASGSYSMVWMAANGVLRITNMTAANTYLDLTPTGWTNNNGGNIARVNGNTVFSYGNFESSAGQFLARGTLSATGNGVGFAVNGGGALRWAGDGVARLANDTAANNSTLWLGQTATGWPFLTGTSNTIPQVTLGGALVVTNLNPGASVLALGVTSSGQLTTNGVTVSATPAGSTKLVQFNDGGVFGSDNAFAWDKSLDSLNVGGSITITGALGFSLNVLGPSLFESYLNVNSYMVTNAHVIAAQDHSTGTASNLTVKAGKTTSGTGGSLNLQTGDATTGTAGAVNITAGAATTGTAGSVNITAGALPASPATGGTAGHVTIQSGDGNSDKRGGNIYLLPGYGDGGGGGTNVIGEDLGAGVTTYNRLVGRTAVDDVAANSFVATTAAGHLTNTLNGATWTNLTSTNIVGQTGVLAPTSQQTNYTLNLLPGSANDTLVLYTANTNAFFTFTRTNEAFVGRTVIFNALTSSVNCSIKFVSPTRTNLNFVNYVTNGTIKVVNFFNIDTAGTNVLVSDAGTYRGSFTQ